MLRTFGRAFKNGDVFKRMLFVLGILVVVRIGSLIPIPGVNTSYFSSLLSSLGEGNLSYLNAFTGGSFERLSLFALSITPYITSSIIVQLLTVAIPKLEEMQREGEDGRKKMNNITRFITIGLAIAESIAMAVGFGRQGLIAGYETMSGGHYVASIFIIVVSLVAGATALMWLGERITDRGIGNGISMIIFGGIVARLPSAVRGVAAQIKDGAVSVVAVIALVIVAVLVTMVIIEMQQGVRKIPVQYAKRVVGRKMYGGQSSHIPIKVNQAGVIPIIFSISLLQFPLTITYFVPNSPFADFVTKYISPSGNPGVWIYAALNILLTVFFTYFYTAIMFNPTDVADNMRQNGGFIPGIRPGTATVEYLSRISSRLCFAGGVFLAAVATIPTIVSVFTPFNFSFGGTSLLIMVGVALDIVQQLENQMLMRNYEGFLR